MNISAAACALLLLSAVPQEIPAPAAPSAAVTTVQDTAAGLQSQAAAYLEKAFSFDVSGLMPQVQEEDGRVSLWFYPDPDQPTDNYYVQLDAGKAYPTMLYHFQHPNTEHVDLASSTTFDFDPQLIETARQYVQTVYGMDCADSAVTAYGYQNKFAVQFKLSEQSYFDVRFYYDAPAPAGILYLTSAAETSAWLDANNGKIFYTVPS